MKARYILASFTVLLALCLGWLRWETRGSSEVVDLDYSGGLQIDTPCIVVKIGRYLDGGTIGGVFEDAKGREFQFSYDGAMRVESPEALAAPRLAYIGAEYPSDEGAYPVPVGSIGEATLIQALSGWVDSVIPENDQERMFSVYFDYTIPGEERMKSLPNLNEESRRALIALQVVRALKEQRAEYSQ